MKIWNGRVQDQFGNKITNGSINIFQSDGVTPAVVYEHDETTVLGQPLTQGTDYYTADGNYAFRYPESDLVIKITVATVTKEIKIGDASTPATVTFPSASPGDLVKWDVAGNVFVNQEPGEYAFLQFVYNEFGGDNPTTEKFSAAFSGGSAPSNITDLYFSQTPYKLGSIQATNDFFADFPLGSWFLLKRLSDPKQMATYKVTEMLNNTINNRRGYTVNHVGNTNSFALVDGEQYTLTFVNRLHNEDRILSYFYTNAITDDPGTSYFALDNADPSLATLIYFDDISASGTGQVNATFNYLPQDHMLRFKGHIVFQGITNTTITRVYYTTGLPDLLTSGGNRIKFPVEFVREESTGFGVDAPYYVDFFDDSTRLLEITTDANFTVEYKHDTVYGDCTSNVVQADVPAASGMKGKQFTFRKTDAVANNFNIDDGSLIIALTGQGDTATIESDGTSWFVVNLHIATWSADIAANTTHRTSDGTDHTFINQDVRTTATPTFNGAAFNNQKITAVATPTAGTDGVNKDYADSLANGMVWQDPVKDKDLTAPPGGPTTGDRYIVASPATGAWAGQEDDIAEWNGSSWDFYTPVEGWATWVEDEDKDYRFNGTAWVPHGSTVDHGNLLGLADDDHTQYHNDTRGDARYFQKTEFLTTSAGAGDAGKPVKLDAAGHIDETMVNDADIDHGSVGGLGDDDHTQYTLLAGRSGGQNIIGGTAASDNLTLESTSNATKGNIVSKDHHRFDAEISSPMNTLSAAAATINTDCKNGQNCEVTLGANGPYTLANPTNVKQGSFISYEITQDGTGSRLLSFGTAFKHPGGVDPVVSTSPGAVDVLTYFATSSGVLNLIGISKDLS